MPTLEGTYHHLHLGSPQAREKRHAGTPSSSRVERPRQATTQLATWPDHFLIWYDRENEPSHGTTVDHFGWSVPDVDATLARCIDAGATLVSDTRLVGPSEDESLRFPIAFFDDPWGTRVELLDDGELRGFHHLHFLVEDVEAIAPGSTTSWAASRASFKKLLPALRWDRLWLLWRPSDTVLARTHDRSIDHFAWRVSNLDEALRALAAKGLEPEEPPRQVGALRVAFVEAPGGIRLELVQPTS